MAIIVRNTNYSGEVLEQLLTLAATSNEIVEKGLIMVIPGVEKKISLPRLKTGKMLQKRKENPGVEDSKGNFNYDEKSLDPVDFMAFTVFNPRTFENIWRKWQPKGNLVFSELPPEAQNALLAELAKRVQFELGDHYVNGEYAGKKLADLSLSELDALNKELAKKGGALIGVNTFTLDGDEAAISEAKDVLAKKGATYQNVYFASDGEAGKFTTNIFAYPTTYVVDRNGNIVGDPIVGAITEKKQAETLQKLIDQALAADMG